MPFGLKTLRVFAFLEIILSVVSFFVIKFLSQIFPFLPSFFSPIDIVLFLLPAVLAALIIMAINLRSSRLYPLVLFGFLIVILSSFRPLFISRANLTGVLSVVPFMLPILFFLWYWIKVKRYFGNNTVSLQDPDIKKVDRIAKPFLVIWIILVLMVIINSFITSSASRLTRNRDSAMFVQQLEGKSYKERIDYCVAQENVAKKDLCLLVSFSLTKNKANITQDSCNLMSEDQYKATCYSMIGACNSLIDEKLRKTCGFLRQLPQ